VFKELWAQVEEVRRAKTRAGTKNWDRVDLLGGLLVCFVLGADSVCDPRDGELLVEG
jgi:hypothetical protein